VPESSIRRVALLMHEAYGLRATEQALTRAIEHRSEGDEIGFDVWSSVAVAIGYADQGRSAPVTGRRGAAQLVRSPFDLLNQRCRQKR